MDVRKSRRLPAAATTPGVKYRLLLRVYAAENLRGVSSHGTYCKVYVGNVDMAASRKGRQSFKKFLMSGSLSSSSSSSSSASTPSSSFSSSISSAGSPDAGNPDLQENWSKSQRNIQNNNSNSNSGGGGGGSARGHTPSGGISTAGTRVREFKTQVQKFSRATPVWNEKFEIPSVDPSQDLVSIRVKSARLMSSPAVGACCVPLRDLPEDETVDRWVPLLDGKKDAGRIRVQMRLMRTDVLPAVKKESSRGQASVDPAADEHVRASVRRTSSKRSNRSSNSSSLSRTRLSGSISPVAASQPLLSSSSSSSSSLAAQAPRKFSTASNQSSNSSSSHVSRSQSRKTSGSSHSGQSEWEAAAAMAPPEPHQRGPQDHSSSGVSTVTTDSMVDLEHVSETSSSSSSSSSFRSTSGLALDLSTVTKSSTTTTSSSNSRYHQPHVVPDNQHDDGDIDDARDDDVVEASSAYNSMLRIRDRGTMLSEIGSSSSSSASFMRTNGSFVGSLHLYNRNSIATSTPSRTTMVMSEAEIVALHSETAVSSASSRSGRTNGIDDRNSNQTEDTDSDDEDDEYSEPETEGPRIPWNSTITRLLARKSTNILIDEDEEDESDEDEQLTQRHQSYCSNLEDGDSRGVRFTTDEVPILDFSAPFDIDEIDCA